jgi:hypothetical protein
LALDNLTDRNLSVDDIIIRDAFREDSIDAGVVSPKRHSHHRRRLARRLIWWGLGAVVLVVLAGVGAVGLWRASRAGHAGQAELAQAELDVKAARFRQANQDLTAAAGDFAAMGHQLHAVPVGADLAVWRMVPFVRVQVEAVDTFADSGVQLSEAGVSIVNAAMTVEQPSGAGDALSGSLGRLRVAETSLHSALPLLDRITSRIDGLGHHRLLGPVGSAQRILQHRLDRIDAEAHTAQQAVDALIVFTGGDGPRQYLVLSQNPDEVRPTGGFMGSYGVLDASSGHVGLDRYDDSVAWVEAHPTAVVPAAEVGSPFRFYQPQLDETIADTNNVPDWPTAAQVALKLWAEGGETPANGVVTFTPQFLADVLAVTGPVQVPSYNETVTAANVIARINYYTHGAGIVPGTNRKEFLSPLGQAVMTKLLGAPPSQWRSLGAAVYQAFRARDLMVWSSDTTVQSTLAARGWVGDLPDTPGDFFDDSEFEYAAKNGSGIQRHIEDQVSLRPDGSGQVTTTITIDNTEAASAVNSDVLTYYTIYGPAGATLDATLSDPPTSAEPSLSGHPAAGWFRTVAALSSATIKVVWDVPTLAQRYTDGSWHYSLEFWHIVDNTGDTLHLTVSLPSAAQWVGSKPPSMMRLDQDVSGTWIYRPGQ